MLDTTKEIQITRLDTALLEDRYSAKSDLVAVEQMIDFVINDDKHLTLLATPEHLEALAVGALFSANMIKSYSEVISLSVDTQGLTPRIDVKIKQILDKKDIKHELLPVRQTFKIGSADLVALVNQCISMQKIFPLTGCAHAAGIFDKNKNFIAFAEDVGRHNALDKTIGMCLMKNLSLQSCGVVLSSRVSYEMIYKAAHAGLELIAAVSAPTTLAIEIAEKCNVTLCGFVRGERANVYTRKEKIL